MALTDAVPDAETACGATTDSVPFRLGPGAARQPLKLRAKKPLSNITGDCVLHAGAADDVRVVFSLANAEGGYTNHDYRTTDQAQDGSVLQVRAPDTPEVANRTVQVQLFLIGHDAPMICHAGTIHIG